LPGWGFTGRNEILFDPVDAKIEELEAAIVDMPGDRLRLKLEGNLTDLIKFMTLLREVMSAGDPLRFLVPVTGPAPATHILRVAGHVASFELDIPNKTALCLGLEFPT
jgi:hypothetical protein